MAKRQRMTNFSDSEKNVLADLTMKYKDFVDNKKTDAMTCKAKELAWRQLADEFNLASTSGVIRDSSQLKHVHRLACVYIGINFVINVGGSVERESIIGAYILFWQMVK